MFDLAAPGSARGPVDIHIEGDRIARITPAAVEHGSSGDQETIDATGMLAMPGLVNAHLHSSGLFNRG